MQASMLYQECNTLLVIHVLHKNYLSFPIRMNSASQRRLHHIMFYGGMNACAQRQMNNIRKLTEKSSYPS